jgi:hypothetical protein
MLLILPPHLPLVNCGAKSKPSLELASRYALAGGSWDRKELAKQLHKTGCACKISSPKIIFEGRKPCSRRTICIRRWREVNCGFSMGAIGTSDGKGNNY